MCIHATFKLKWEDLLTWFFFFFGMKTYKISTGDISYLRLTLEVIQGHQKLNNVFKTLNNSSYQYFHCFSISKVLIFKKNFLIFSLLSTKTITSTIQFFFVFTVTKPNFFEFICLDLKISEYITLFFFFKLFYYGNLWFSTIMQSRSSTFQVLNMIICNQTTLFVGGGRGYLQNNDWSEKVGIVGIKVYVPASYTVYHISLFFSFF